MEQSRDPEQLIHLVGLRRDDDLIDRPAATPLHDEPAVGDGCRGDHGLAPPDGTRTMRSHRVGEEMLKSEGGARAEQVDSANSCACGHTASAHEHFRPGSECSLCRSRRACTRFRHASPRAVVTAVSGPVLVSTPRFGRARQRLAAMTAGLRRCTSSAGPVGPRSCSSVLLSRPTRDSRRPSCGAV